jgi:hypothetical protein
MSNRENSFIVSCEVVVDELDSQPSYSTWGAHTRGIESRSSLQIREEPSLLEVADQG